MVAAAIAAAALCLPVTLAAADPPPKKPAATARPTMPPVTRSADVDRMVQWIAASGDNGILPYIIIDKQAAALFLFDAKGTLVAESPVLLGVAQGDESTPGIGSKSLATIGPAERTTPAGRFVAKFGLAAGRQRVLWVDYATSVALHIVITTNRKERRLERLLSPTEEDNRVTFGCINVGATLFNKQLSPLFTKRGGVVYILPDSKSMDEVFPRVRLLPYLQQDQPS
ncbi:MAG: hypothetical protein WA842_14015 [Croceibacterium sp.]